MSQTKDTPGPLARLSATWRAESARALSDALASGNVAEIEHLRARLAALERAERERETVAAYGLALARAVGVLI